MAATKSKYEIQRMTLMFVMSDTNDYISLKSQRIRKQRTPKCTPLMCRSDSGLYVVVIDINEYPGEVTSISDINGVKVNVMHSSGSGWKWPHSKDMIFYDKNDIACPPVAALWTVYLQL